MATFRNLTSPGTVYSFFSSAPAWLPGWESGGHDGVMINDERSLHGVSGSGITRHTVVADVKMNVDCISKEFHFVLASRHKGGAYSGVPDNMAVAAIAGCFVSPSVTNFHCPALELIEWNGGGTGWPVFDPHVTTRPHIVPADQYCRYVIESAWDATKPVGQRGRVAMRVFNKDGVKIFDTGDIAVSNEQQLDIAAGRFHVVFAKIFMKPGMLMWAKSFKSTWTGATVRVSDAEIVGLGAI